MFRDVQFINISGLMILTAVGQLIEVSLEQPENIALSKAVVFDDRVTETRFVQSLKALSPRGVAALVIEVIAVHPSKARKGILVVAEGIDESVIFLQFLK